ncbi:MAG TPA: phosphotransferase [Actinomycetota bacterium]|nr:phosphotransferase [Actinomycetota bacterium]
MSRGPGGKSSHAASVEDDRDLVARLFPELSLDAFEPVAGGWTCATYLADGSWIVQLPRSPYAEERLRRQIDLLPELAREVSSAVPAPELVSLDPMCMGYRAIEGVRCDAVTADGMWPERLGRFCYDLHMTPPEFLGMRATSAAAVREVRLEEWCRLRDAAEPHLASGEVGATSSAIDDIFADPTAWSFAPCVTHGDLVPEHVLVSPSGDLAGVLDWEEAGMDDPARDFAWFLHAAPSEGERMLAAYGGAPDAGFLRRAALWFVLMPLHELRHGLESGRAELVASGAHGFVERLGKLDVVRRL